MQSGAEVLGHNTPVSFVNGCLMYIGYTCSGSCYVLIDYDLLCSWSTTNTIDDNNHQINVTFN